MNLPFGVKTVAFILNPPGVVSTPSAVPIRYKGNYLYQADSIRRYFVENSSKVQAGFRQMKTSPLPVEL